MRKKIISIGLFLSIVLMSDSQLINGCSSNKQIGLNIAINDSLTSQRLKETLWRQLKQGESALYDKAFDIETYKYSKDDLDCLIPYLAMVLKANGFYPPTKEAFAHRIEELFNRKIDYSTNLKYLYVNMDNPQDRKHKFYRSDNSIEIRPLGLFVVKDYCFITQLYAIPEVVNYQLVFPEIYNMESEITTCQIDKSGNELLLYLWKDSELVDVERSLKVFVARNKLLLNNDTTVLEWLLKNDELFMESLKNTYGYQWL